MRKTIAVLMTVLTLGFSGCGTTKYNSSYINFDQYLLIIPRPEKILIITTKDADEKLFKKTTMFVKYSGFWGKYVKNISLKIFERSFTGGVKHVNEMPDSEKEYDLIINPRISDHKAYRHMGLLGETPVIEIVMDVIFYDKNKKIILKKQYTSGELQGKSEFFPTIEAINKLAHKAIAINMKQILSDTQKLLDR